MPGLRDAIDVHRPVRVLVVCAGNTCRSPAARAAIEAAAARRGITIEVTSAGTSAVEGAEPSEMIRRVAASRGIQVSGTAHQVESRDLNNADIVLAVDRSVELFLSTLGSHMHKRIDLLRSYVETEIDEIADPWGKAEDDYSRTLDLIVEAAEAFVAALSG